MEVETGTATADGSSSSKTAGSLPPNLSPANSSQQSISSASASAPAPASQNSSVNNNNTNTNATTTTSNSASNSTAGVVAGSSGAGAGAGAATKSSKKRNRENTTPAALTTALQTIHTTFATTFPAHAQLPAFQSLVHGYLTSKSANLSQLIVSNILHQVQVAASKSLNDIPPYVHLSTRDAAPQLLIQDHNGMKKLSVRGGMRGFRMVRASQGVEAGCWYYEAVVMDPPTVTEVISALPCNVRLGDGVREGLRKGLEKEQEQQKQHSNRTSEGAGGSGGGSSSGTGATSTEEGKKKRRKNNVGTSSAGVEQYGIGGHLRMGWSMRTGELQAPVGYDRWSYGIRDVQGSRIHNSKREDKWGGEGFGPGDVVGFAICLVDKDDKPNSFHDEFSGGSGSTHTRKNYTPVTSNHIRFFKNGAPMGHFIVSRGIKTGGEAFDNIKAGTYYPAISSYMGGTARVNFGPHFICPPRGLPTGMKLRPISEMCPAPMEPGKVLEEFKKEKFLGKRVEADIVEVMHKAVLAEAKMRYDAYQKYRRDQLEEVRRGRNERGAGTSDLPALEPDTNDTVEDTPMDGV